jgi:hypothetical protein
MCHCTTVTLIPDVNSQFQHAIFAGQAPKAFSSFVETPIGSRLDTQVKWHLFPFLCMACAHDEDLDGS